MTDILQLNNRIIDGEGNVVYFTPAIMEMLYRDSIPSEMLLYPLDDIDVELFNKFAYENFDEVSIKLPTKLKTHDERKNHWFYPPSYDDINLETYFTNISKDNDLDRIKQELQLYKEKSMEKFLRFCIYLADNIKENGWVVGVGRGSSVCSYLLFLLQINLVNPIEYSLDIKEFLK